MTASAERLAAVGTRWWRRGLAVAGLRTLATVLPFLAGAGTAAFHGAPATATALGVAALALGFWGWRRWRPARIDAEAVARHLDRSARELEESSELLLRRPEELPLLARLQRQRVQPRLAHLALGPPPAALRRALAGLGVAATLALVTVWALPLWLVASPSPMVATGAMGETSAVAAPGVRSIAASIVPPAYTGRAARTVEGLDLEAEEGAEVTWRLETTGEVAAAALVFEEAETMAFERGADGTFVARRRADETKIYRLEWTRRSGEVTAGAYARFEVVPDSPPELTIVEPERFVELPPARGQQLEIVVEAQDDYGLGPVALVATVASGYGELVEFRERRLELDRETPLERGGRRLASRLDLDSLGVGPGVELFFFAEGYDRRQPSPQRARSATHIVRLPGDTAQSVGLSSRLPILRVPEFFRSQRQIILDTERLLAEEAAITAAEFRRRSESLGFDQRALRQRYGGLLGEEFESGRPAGIDGEVEEHDEEGLRFDEMRSRGGGREDVREALETLTQGLAHQHDSAEVATFFDSEIKAQLKAALEEMWGAEGKLRTLDPRRALPFEYRALTLLKDVQQRSRLYVQKIGFEAPVLYPEEKRLTGDLSAIRTRRSQDSARPDRELAAVRLAVAALQEGGSGPLETPDILAAAREGARALAEQARKDPQVDLAGLEAVRAWIRALESGRRAPPDVLTAAAGALWSLLPEPRAAPELTAAGVTDLARDYRLRLAAEDGP